MGCRDRNPFNTLRFKPGQSIWGLNVERDIKRRQEVDRWTAARQNIWIGNLAEAGRLEGLDEPFEISDGVVVPPGSYRWSRYSAEVETADKRPWEVEASWRWGRFYGGTLRQLELDVMLKPNTHVALSAQFERNDVELPEGSFNTDVLTLRADYNFTPNVSWANLTQYDNESRIAGWQSRFRWILRPGNDLFFVVNRGWFRRLDDDRFESRFNRESAKLQYTFRF
jgi:hypothetical protein